MMLASLRDLGKTSPIPGIEGVVPKTDGKFLFEDRYFIFITL